MKKHTLIRQSTNGTVLETPTFVGAFETHASANKHMQTLFDKETENDETVFDKEDCDASHFYVDHDDEVIHWYIIEIP